MKFEFAHSNTTMKQGNYEDTSSKAMLAIDGVGFDWSDMAEEQISDKSKKGLGYSVVPPPHPLIYNRPKKINLSYSGLDEFKEPEFKGYGPEDKQASKDTSSFVDSLHNVDKETTFPVDKKVGDEVVHKELGDRMERAATTASSLEAEQDSAKIPYWGCGMLKLEKTRERETTESSKETKNGEIKNTMRHEEVEEVDEAELKKHLVIVKDDDIAIDAIPLATKPPLESMGDWISKRYSSMIRMLQDIDREDLQTLWKLVKTKHGDTRPEDEHERVLWECCGEI
ncbi:hypothetical protein Tco_1320855 [Tanacetum coccineum]